MQWGQGAEGPGSRSSPEVGGNAAQEMDGSLP